MPEQWIVIGVIVAAVVLIAFGVLVMIAKFYRKVDQGKALIINKMGKEPVVTFTGGVVYPIFHRAEVMDISVKTIDIDRRGKDGLICRDNIRADIKVTFFVRVNKTVEDVLQVAQSIGCQRASDQETLEALFVAKFSEALKSAGKGLDFEDLYTKREEFRDMIIGIIGQDLNGYKLEDAAIDYLEQTPIEALDPENILDAQGIRKITEITSQQNVHTNQLRQVERKAISKQNVEADEAVFALDRQRADAEAKRDREIATVRAREHALTLQIQAEERAKAEKARIKAEEEIQIEEENRLRQVEVAQKNRERIIAIEAERVAKDRQLEAVSREHEVEIRRIAKNKAVEIETTAISNEIAKRIAVDRSVAEQEEAIKDLRVVAEAKRSKEARLITAQADAEEKLVRDLKAAEAAEQVARFTAKERLTLAEAAREAADKEAQAKIRAAEGIQAEVAAEGLARVRVKEADAVATEKMGLAEATVALQKLKVKAQGDEEIGMAAARIKHADAEATQKHGLAEAAVVREKLLAEARGEEEKGLAMARIQEAEAVALEKTGLAEAVGIEKRGLAEAVATREKLVAEAAGLAEKAAAMKALDGVGREHEEFRLRLEKEREIELANVHVRRDVAQAQATVLAQAFANASINIVGGDGQFFDRFMNAVSVGKSIDGFVDNSEAVQTLLKDYLAGEGSLTHDLKEVLSRPALDAGTLQQLSLSALFARLASGADGETRLKLESLLARAQELGLADRIAGTGEKK